MSEEQSGVEVQSRASYTKNGPATYKTGPYNGTGPYQYKERTQSQFIRFERTPFKHWRATPDFQEFEFRFVQEASTRMAALLTGEAHVATLPTDQTAEVQKQGYKVVTGKVPALRVFMNFYCCMYKDPANLSAGYMDPSSPLTDVRVRTAISKAINRDELNKTLFAGKGETAPARPPHHPHTLLRP